MCGAGAGIRVILTWEPYLYLPLLFLLLCLSQLKFNEFFCEVRPQ